MKIQTQKEFNEIKSDYRGDIIIEDTKEWLNIYRSFDNADIYVSGNATIKYVYENATIQSVGDNATIQSVGDNATIEDVYGNATIKYVYGNATIKYVYENATIQSVGDNATIQSVGGNATIKYVYGNATIKYVYENATIELLTMFATITALYLAKKVTAKGNSIIRCFNKNIDIEKTKGVTVIYQDKKLIKENTVKEFCELFPVEKRGTKLILYKAVHKINGKYIADYDKTTEYKIGINEAKKFNDTTKISCTEGIHISYLGWAERFGSGWKDLAILKCEVNPKDIIVADYCDGKVRAKKINVIKEI